MTDMKNSKTKWRPADVGLSLRPDTGLDWHDGVGPSLRAGVSLREVTEHIINVALLSLGYAPVTVNRSNQLGVDFQCNMHHTKPLTYDMWCDLFGEVAILEYAKLQDEDLYALCVNVRMMV